VTIAPAPSAARSLRRRILERGRDQAVPDRAVLVLHDVTKQYPNGKIALRDVDLVIPEGDFVFLVGPSGAGKSTLIKLLIRDEVATRGEVVLDGQDLARLPRRQVPRMRRKIGIIFQDFKLLPTKTVWENVAFALEVTGYPRRQIRPAVDRVLAIVGLTAQSKQVPAQLSGGEQQRTAIARALVHDPRLIIADEPTGNLDPLISWEILQLLLRINELGVTVLMATHNAEVVTALRKRGRRARGGPGHPRRGRWRVPPRGLTARAAVPLLQPQASLARVLAERRDELRSHRDDGPHAAAPRGVLDHPDRPACRSPVHRAEGPGRRLSPAERDPDADQRARRRDPAPVGRRVGRRRDPRQGARTLPRVDEGARADGSHRAAR
jgi:cell division transport system ATP-binding protein